MTRKILLSVLFAAAVLSAAAQRPALGWSGASSGVSTSRLHDQYGQDRCQEQTGLAGGIVTAVNLGAFAVEPQILYVRQGLRIRPEGGKEINLKSNSIDVPVLASFRLLNPVRIYAGPVFTVMNDCKQKSGGDLLDFGRVRPTLSYTVGAGVVLMRHLLIDLRYNGQFRSKHEVVLPDGSQLDKLRTYNVALSFGYLF